MKVILVAVMSIDGRITPGEDAHTTRWNSKEDREHFVKIKSSAEAIISGRKSFDMATYKRDANTKIVVHTKDTKRQENKVSDNVIFTTDSPKEVVGMLEREGHKEVLILGGSTIYSLYLEAGLVDEMWLTVEPKIFGTGKQLVNTKSLLNLNFSLSEIVKLNENTILLKYSR